jgi:hypothetical protein
LLTLLAMDCSRDDVLGYGPERAEDGSYVGDEADGSFDAAEMNRADTTTDTTVGESSTPVESASDAGADGGTVDASSDATESGASDAGVAPDVGDATPAVDDVSQPSDASSASDTSDAMEHTPDAAIDVQSGGPILSQACTVDGWCWTNPLPQGNPLRGAWGFSASDVWAVGDGGAAVHFVGTGWSGTTSGTANDLRAVWGFTPSDVWAVGANGTIVHWDGNGWSPSPTPTTATLQSVSGTGPGDVWAVGTGYFCAAFSCSTDGGSILHWDGSTWASVTTGIESSVFLYPQAVLANAPDDVWVGGANGVLHWNGTAWSVDDVVPGTSVVQLRGTGKNDVWAVGKIEQINDSTVTVSHWDGTAWTTITTPPIRAYKSPLDYIGAGGTGPNDLWISHGGLTHWDGNVWSSVISGASSAIWLSAPGDGWAVGDIGQTRHWNGTAWSAPASSLSYGLSGVWGAAPDDIWAVGAKNDVSPATGRILHWDGTVWSESASAPSSLSAVWGSGAKDVWAVGYQTIQHWDGSSWQTSPSPSGAYSVWGSGPNDVFAAASDLGQILHWDGSTWSYSVNDPNIRVRFIAGSGPKDVWAVGEGAIPSVGLLQPSLFHFDGVAWTRTTLGTYSISGVWSVSPTNAWAGTSEGVIFHWDGEGWSPWGDPVGYAAGMVWGGPSGEIWASVPQPTRGALHSEVVRSNGTSWIVSETGTAETVSAGVTIGNTTWVVGGNGMALQRAIPLLPGDAGADAASVDGSSDGGVESGGPQVAQISMASYGQCSLLTDGTVTCQSLLAPSGVFTEVSVGGMNGGPPFACGVRADKSLACWGFNAKGQATPPSGTFSHVSAGTQHACAVRDDKTLACWGNNTTGESSPPAGSFVEVAAGDTFSCAIKDDASLTCWGTNYIGESTPPSGSFLKVSASGDHACALRTDNTVACWGDPSQGQTDAPSGPFQQVAAGSQSTCGLRPNGGVTCWGRWHDTTILNAPTGTFRQIAQANTGGCGVLASGKVSCWSGYQPGG